MVQENALGEGEGCKTYTRHEFTHTHTLLLCNIIPTKNKINTFQTGARGGAVVKALRYKPEGCGSIPDGVRIFH
jgi:hypothetical protein